MDGSAQRRASGGRRRRLRAAQPRDGAEPDVAEDRTREVERLKALGASEVNWSKRPPDADYFILADAEGYRFCVVDASQ
ncbi:MAG TPA: VOC family protein [Candidatus Dormibacteraeota bacterium]|nr:VOC family protein [Candidatus Dormibacteraeota bacterium]